MLPEQRLQTDVRTIWSARPLLFGGAVASNALFFVFQVGRCSGSDPHRLRTLRDRVGITGIADNRWCPGFIMTALRSNDAGATDGGAWGKLFALLAAIDAEATDWLRPAATPRTTTRVGRPDLRQLPPRRLPLPLSRP